MAWGAAKHVLKSAPPVQMVRQLSHNLDLASAAANQVWAGDYGLALCTMLKMPYEGALGAASIITGPIEAAIEIPDMVRTAVDAADPEVKGAAAVQALQDIATVGLTVVAVGQAVKGPGSTAGSGAKAPSKIDRAAFKAERAAFWKGEAKNSPGSYSPENLAKMEKGRAPTGPYGHPIELHHVDRTPEGGLKPMSRTDHRLGENYKKNHP